MKTRIKTGLKDDRRENLHIHWGVKELLMVLAFLAAPTAGIINTMIKADNNAIKIEAVEKEAGDMQDDINLNKTDIAVSTNKIENIDETVKRIENLMIDFIKANDN